MDTPSQQPVSIRRSFRLWYEAGFTDLIPVIPPNAPLSPTTRIKPDQRGKVPGTKGFSGWYGFDWRNHTATEADIARWDADGANTGLRAGLFPGLDIDVTDERLSDLIRAIAEQHLGKAPVRTGRAPKMLLVFRLAPGQEPMSRRRLWFKDPEGNNHLIEMLGDGQQYVVDGRHPVTQRAYTWDRHPADGRVEDLPTVTRAQIDAFFADIEAGLALFDCESFSPEGSGSEARDRDTINQDELRAPSAEKVTELVRAISNFDEAFPDRTSYLTLGYAIKAALPDDPDRAQDIFLEWALSWEGNDRFPNGNDEETVLADWARMKPPYSVGYDYLVGLAAQHGYGDAADDFEVLEGDFQPVKDGKAAANVSKYAPIPQRIPDGFRPSSLPTRPWVLGRRFLRGAVTAGLGAPGVSKSTMTLLSAMAVTTGRSDLTGEAVKVTGKVWIHNNEDDATEILRRIAGLCVHYDIDFDDIRDKFLFSSGLDRRLLVAIKTKDRVSQTRVVQEAVDIINAEGIVFMGVDPFVSTHSGTEENSNDDIEAVAAIFRQIAKQTNIAIDLVHHTVKNHTGNSEARAGDMNASRGAGALIGAVRVSYTLMPMDQHTAEENNIDKSLAARLVRMDWAKGNYSVRTFDAVWFELKSVDLGNGGDIGNLDEESDSVGVPVRCDLATLALECSERADDELARLAEDTFLKAIDRFNDEGVTVSERERAGNYAPRIIAKASAPEGPKVPELERAMYSLFACGKIEIGPVGKDKFRHTVNGLALTAAGKVSLRTAT